MRCPYCADPDNSVVDSREAEDGVAIRRRRSCNACKRRFTTYERVEVMPVIVVKRDGRRQTFDRVKLEAGVARACEKRPVSSTRISSIVADIERRAHEMGEKEIASVWVGEQVMHALKDLDEVAYVRFASVYRSFKDVEEFARELEKLKDTRARSNAMPLEGQA
jgi:transcriptional repressor NrdR